MKLWYAVWLDAEVKISHTFTEVAQKVAHQFLLKQLCYSKYPKSLGYFCKKICHSDVSWIAQSGRTGGRCRTLSIKISTCRAAGEQPISFFQIFPAQASSNCVVQFYFEYALKRRHFCFHQTDQCDQISKIGPIWQF